jgi:hypothetical protein
LGVFIFWVDLWLHLSFLLYGWVRISAVNQVIGNRTKVSRILMESQNPRGLHPSASR